jgi:hypothetical protein
MVDKTFNSDVELIMDAFAHHDPEGDLDTAKVALAALAGAERLRSDDLSAVKDALHAEVANCRHRQDEGPRANRDWWNGGQHACERLAERLGIEL